jgi:hypothetical protein
MRPSPDPSSLRQRFRARAVSARIAASSCRRPGSCSRTHGELQTVRFGEARDRMLLHEAYPRLNELLRQRSQAAPPAYVVASAHVGAVESQRATGGSRSSAQLAIPPAQGRGGGRRLPLTASPGDHSLRMVCVGDELDDGAGWVGSMGR